MLTKELWPTYYNLVTKNVMLKYFEFAHFN